MSKKPKKQLSKKKLSKKKLSISKRWFRFPLFIINWVLAPLATLGALGLIVLMAALYHYDSQLPTEMELRNNIHVQLPLRVYSRDKKLIAEFGEYRRRPLKREDIPDDMVNAFLAIEDSRFYQHNGVDFIGVARAVVKAIKNGSASEGASTITMQVARNFFLTRKRKLDRKLKEILLAGRIEKYFTKDEILELYLNKIFLGNRSYGVGSAAEIYYGNKVKDLTLAQTAMIAGLPKAPSAYNPIARPERAKQRRDYILQRMLAQKYINQKQYQTAVNEPITARIHKRAISESNAPYVAEMARNYVNSKYGEDVVYHYGMKVYTTIDSAEQELAVNTLRKHLMLYNKRHGYRGPETTFDLNKIDSNEILGLLRQRRIIADLVPALVLTSDDNKAMLITAKGNSATFQLSQLKWARPYISHNRRGSRPKRVSDVLKRGDVVRVSRDDNGKWQLSPLPKVSGSLVSMDPETGAVLSIVGGFDYSKSKFNRAIQARRQPGSSFKPFVYASALAKGYSPASVVNDAPLNIPGSKWKPENYSGKVYGPTRLRHGLKKSRNLVSINLLRELGIQYTRNYIEPFGFPKKDIPANLTLALGTGSVTPYQMAGAYSVLANGGYRVEPHFIQQITDSQNRYVEEFVPRKICRNCVTNPKKVTKKRKLLTDKHAPRIMQPYVNYQIVSMLQSVVESGTAVRAKSLKRNDIAGKTGTTNDQKDAWFCGFAPKKVGVVWIGFDDMQKMGKRETATALALPTWIDFMKVALKDVPKQPLKPPRGMVAVSIDGHNGYQADQASTQRLTEYLTRKQIPGRTPDNFSYNTGELLNDQHVIAVNNPNAPHIVQQGYAENTVAQNDAQSDLDLLAQQFMNEDDLVPQQTAQQAPQQAATRQATAPQQPAQQKTRTLQIGDDLLEIPEQLF